MLARAEQSFTRKTNMPTYSVKIRIKAKESKTIKIVESCPSDAEKSIKKQYPDWEIIDVSRSGDNNTFKALHSS
jgi:hypothetical protein